MPTNGQFAVGELVTASDANTLFTRGYQNRIINGAFVINQRGYVSTTNLASGSYGFDRWKSGYTNTALTFTAGSQSTTVTISASGVLQQIIERENMPAGTYTLSWTGTATGRVYNSGGSAPAYAASPITVSLDGTANVVVEFTASGGTKTLGLVQLEAGNVYSPFEYRQRSDELALCQRYYFRTSSTASNLYSWFAFGMAASTTGAEFWMPLPVTMRATPTTLDVANLRMTDLANAYTVFTITLSAVRSSASQASFGVTSSGLTAYRSLTLEANNSAAGYVGVGAEL